MPLTSATLSWMGEKFQTAPGSLEIAAFIAEIRASLSS